MLMQLNIFDSVSSRAARTVGQVCAPWECAHLSPDTAAVATAAAQIDPWLGILTAFYFLLVKNLVL